MPLFVAHTGCSFIYPNKVMTSGYTVVLMQKFVKTLLGEIFGKGMIWRGSRRDLLPLAVLCPEMSVSSAQRVRRPTRKRRLRAHMVRPQWESTLCPQALITG